jgi:hypothetical protein
LASRLVVRLAVPDASTRVASKVVMAHYVPAVATAGCAPV